MAVAPYVDCTSAARLGTKPRVRPSCSRRQLSLLFPTSHGRVQLDGVEAALDKWKGRVEKMFAALNKKYDAEIKAYWDKEKDKEEL